VLNYDLDKCRRRVTEYSATKGQPGFDPKKLHEMVNGCAYRQALLKHGLRPGEAEMLIKLIANEPPDLWSIT
jgi:hypothetical protein